jgi:hypothetical protein
MNARQLMIGCVLALVGGIGIAQAADLDGQDLGTTRVSSDAVARDANAGGDTSSGTHENGAHDTEGEAGNGILTPGAAAGGGDAPHTPSTHRAGLGWQSLLPGSIQ